ncbi:hypothetical protein LB505_002228 [Fusarium chuoi]|nr:hypothetical protein LB505_002228 [Fusarium chuoi]
MSTTTSGPGLPEIAALQADDSMLTRRFGKEVVNYYAGGHTLFYVPILAFFDKPSAALQLDIWHSMT